jgi:hypothetical protein
MTYIHKYIAHICHTFQKASFQNQAKWKQTQDSKANFCPAAVWLSLYSLLYEPKYGSQILFPSSRNYFFQNLIV